MSSPVSVSFPPSMAFSSIAESTIKGIVGTSFLLFKFPNAKETIIYKGVGTVSNNLTTGAQSVSTANIMIHRRYINSLIGSIMGNCVKIYLNGVLATIENSVCIDDYLTLKIPDSSNSEIVYQAYITLARFQGTLICEYTYGNNNFTIQNIYFTLTKNSFFNLTFEDVY